jgi:putative endopeptidase
MNNVESKEFDLYKITNEEWENNFNIPPDQSEWGTFKEISQNVKNRLEETLSNTDDINNSNPEFDIVRDFYQLFMNINKNTDENEAKSIINILKYLNHNNYNDRSDIGHILGFLEIIMINPLFDSIVTNDPTNTDDVKLTLSFPSLTLPDRIYYIDNSYSDYRESYEKHANNVVKIYSDLVGKNQDLECIMKGGKFGKKVVDTEIKLAKSTKTSEQTRDISSIYSKMPITSFIESIIVCDIGNNSYDCATARKLWQNYFYTAYADSIKSLSKNNSNLEIKIPGEIIVFDIHYFQKLTQILMTIPLDELMVYISYKLISSTCMSTVRSFDDTYRDFFNIKLNGQKTETSRKNKSLDLVNKFLGESLGKIYTEKYFNNESKNIVKNIVKNIMVEMDKSIKSNTWMSKNTKDVAIIKLNNMGVKIGFPDKYIDRSEMIKGVHERINKYKQNIKQNEFNNNVTLTNLLIYIRTCYFGKDVLERIDTKRDTTRWEMNPHEVNAYYNPQMNEIVFPAGILHKPIFDPDRDALNNYGSIGVIIAHEITHGFDDQGRKFDHKGNLKNWWTIQDQFNFNLLTKKMIDQYSNYEVVINNTENFTSYDVSNTINQNNNNNIIKVNGNLTLGENIADLGGVTLSYKALLSERNYSSEEKKKFFESYSLLWRKKMSPNKMLSRILSDPHSPNKYRIWIVRNLDEFYDVYNVTNKSPMYLDPRDRIKIY